MSTTTEAIVVRTLKASVFSQPQPTKRGARLGRLSASSYYIQQKIMAVQERDPCPHRIFDDIGGAFAMGAIGGGVWNSVKGARNSPRGERLLGSVTAVKARAPVMGGALGDSLALPI